MRRFAFYATLLVFALALPAAAHGQFAGKWNFEMGEWQTDGGANIQIRSPNTATMEFTIKGDSAIGTWTTPGGTSPPTTVRGKIEGTKLVATGTRDGRVNVNGEESTVTITLTFELTAAAGELTGTMRLSGANNPAASRTVKGKKAAD